MISTRVEILVVGREILTGHTLDTNSRWLAARVTDLGGQVSRIAVTDDVVDDIAREVKASLAGQTRLLLTTGGLGPTHDDMTLAGIARAVNRRLILCPEALDFIARRYQELFAQGLVESSALTPPRKKMAELPEGARWLPNLVGTAPGVLVEEAGTVIVSLPGIPGEMKTIFDTAVASEIAKIMGTQCMLEREVLTGIGDESVLTQAMEKVMKDIPHVYLKSLPTGFQTDRHLRVRISARGSNRQEVEERFRKAVTMLEGALSGVAT